MKRTLFSLFAIPLMGAALAANAADAAPVVYQYGMKLDVAKVISIEQANDRCEVAPAKMTYADSKGQVHVLEYLRQTEMCSDI
ncbi:MULTISPECIES: DUF2790 domain-containing protein [Pseudomonas]|uniref:DUF2790 domain-containing protein n=1 Tax=Pseudomonas delhiensis TaxID=366289 RepID=A0A239MLI7_9PSED|nr:MULTISPECIES: DUF2790 domain-containing protein [Pseudomonas]MED5609152.1 DUF2790 domain-containing protein [Pseudomonas sp. JH-2]PWU26758.1 DUF2790 domain-containing protein [Pseudomonas sp. RW407]SDI20466.1 Protein of unknown function [Pseudomonas delhiensis]SNT43340.1 Protein of unknown function [Pseudomonas delhiensis]